MNDKEIVELYWQRSDRAIAETDKKYGRYCHSIAYNITGNAEDAEECVNDTWLSAWNAMPDKRPERLNPFLGRITRNHAITRIRRRSVQKRGGGAYDLALEELDECLESGFRLERELELRELSGAVNRFVAALSEDEQTAFVGRYWFLASEKEIAEKLGCSRSRISMLLKKIRRSLKNYLMEEGLCETRSC